MRKIKYIKPIWKYILFCLLGVAATLLFLFGLKWFPKDSVIDFPTLLIAVGIIAALYGVIWSTNKQILNQNIENHKPFLVVNTLNINTDGGSTFALEVKSDFPDDKYETLMLNLEIENIGYGIAKNIDFFSLAEPNISLARILRYTKILQTVKTSNDIGANKSKSIFFDFRYPLFSEIPGKKAQLFGVELLMIYSDLYGTIYFSTIYFNILYNFSHKTSHLDYYLSQHHSKSSYELAISESTHTLESILNAYNYRHS